MSLRYYNLGKIHEARGDTGKARSTYTQALQIARQFYPEDNWQIRHLQEKLQGLGKQAN
ncbi:hypothetical protein D3C85_1488510 [compost metagenome]